MINSFLRKMDDIVPLSRVISSAEIQYLESQPNQQIYITHYLYELHP